MRNRVQRSTLLLRAPVAAAVLLTGGCGTGPEKGAGTGKPVTMGITDEVTSVDPAAGYDPGSWIVFNNVFQSLLSFPRGATTPEPDAASKCAFTDGGSRVFRCTLRDGLTFSNGDPLTSQDVAYSFRRTLRIHDPGGPTPLLSTIGTIDTPDEHTVVFNLRQPDATFPLKIASGAGSIVDHRVYPMDKLRTDGKAIGSGVYKLDSYEARKKAVFSVNPGYPGTAVVRNSGMTMRFFADQRALKKAVEDGAVDLAYRGLATADIAALQKSSGGGSPIQVVEGSGAEVQHLVFNLKDTVVGNAAVRKAVAYLIDRQAMIRDVYQRTADPLYSIIPAGITGHSTPFFGLYGDHPDPDKARRVLRDAGVTGPVRFTLWGTPVRYGPGTVAELEQIARQLNDTGLFQVQVRSTDAEQYAKGIAQGAYAVYVKGWVPDYPDPDNFTAPFFGDDNVLGNHYDSPRITGQLIPQTAGEPSRARTIPEFHALEDIVAQDVPIIPLWQGKQYVVAKSVVHGLEWTLDASTVFRFWEIQKADE